MTQILGRFGQLKEELDAGRRQPSPPDERRGPPLARSEAPRNAGAAPRSFDGDFVHSTVPRYIEAVREGGGGLPQLTGELRFGYRYAFAVMGGCLFQPDLPQAGELATARTCSSATRSP